MEYPSPVTIADLLEVDAKLMASYMKCGHHMRIDPVSLPFKADMTVPGLAGKFKCRFAAAEISSLKRAIRLRMLALVTPVHADGLCHQRSNCR